MFEIEILVLKDVNIEITVFWNVRLRSLIGGYPSTRCHISEDHKLENILLSIDMKVYWKPTHTGHYLHFKSNQSRHVKRGVVDSLVSRAKAIRQDQKDFNNEIKNIRHDLMLNEYPKKYIDCIMKPLSSNYPSSDTLYQGTVLNPYVKHFPEKFRRIGNHFNLRTIFKTLYGTPMKIGLNCLKNQN
jgi:hypothetical protein